MSENEILVEQTENVEHTTEETPKMFTQDEVNEIVGKSKARERAKVTRQLEKKYGQLEEVLRAGTGANSVEEITDTFAKFYEGKGIKINKPTYSAQDIDVLARADAADIISGGYEDVVEETDRLADIGVANMSEREKAVFKVLAEHRQNAERSRELSKIGVTEDVYNSQDFKDFAGKFTANTPIKDVYDIYRKTLPKKDITTMGSMKNSTSEDGTVKDFYTREEALKFTKKDFDKNPALFKAVEASMLKW
jgi:hypothetical protein